MSLGIDNEAAKEKHKVKMQKQFKAVRTAAVKSSVETRRMREREHNALRHFPLPATVEGSDIQTAVDRSFHGVEELLRQHYGESSPFELSREHDLSDSDYHP